MQIDDDLWRPLGRLIFLLILTFLSSSCSSKKDLNSRCFDSKNMSSNFALLKEAKHSDIPVPIGYTCFDLNFDENKNLNYSELICYAGDLAVDQVTDFYRQNMERMGWEISDLSVDNKEGLLFCNKLSKSSVVSIRDDQKSKNKSKIFIFIKNKFLYASDVNKDLNAKKILFESDGLTGKGQTICL